MTEQKPPQDPLHRQLWAMGFNLEQREAIINIATWKTISTTHFHDPLVLARCLMAERSRGAIEKLSIVIATCSP